MTVLLLLGERGERVLSWLCACRNGEVLSDMILARNVLLFQNVCTKCGMSLDFHGIKILRQVSKKSLQKTLSH